MTKEAPMTSGTTTEDGTKRQKQRRQDRDDTINEGSSNRAKPGGEAADDDEDDDNSDGDEDGDRTTRATTKTQTKIFFRGHPDPRVPATPLLIKQWLLRRVVPGGRFWGGSQC